MNRIERKFEELKHAGKKALILFVTAGDPDIKTTERLITKLFDAGADMVEIGVPFSDPLADGPAIQASYMRALRYNVNLPKIFVMVKRLREKTDEPLILMSAYNLIHHYGTEKFAKDAGKAGVDGVIFPDLTPEEASVELRHFKRNNIYPIFLAAPTSGISRIKKITRASGGFVYYISVKGITGDKNPSEKDVRRQVAMIKKVTRLPVACGFGIKTPEQAAKIGKITDGVIVGSAVVKLLTGSASKNAKIKRIINLVRRLRAAL